MAGENIQWHPAFAAALKLEMKDYYPDVIDIKEEHQLSSKPLEIDILVVKKLKEVPILKNIGEIFKQHNIIEYKSPDDYLSIDDYYKVKAYAYLYKSLVQCVDEVKIENITITMVSNSYPASMVRHIERVQNVRIRAHSQGIYYIEGEDVLTQLIVVDNLPEKVNRFVRLLSKKLNVKREIAELFEDYAKEAKNNEYEILVDLITEVHLGAMVEVLNMPRVLTREEQEKLEKLVEKFNINRKWEMKGRIEGENGVIVRLLKRKFGTLPEALLQEIYSIKDTDLIDAIIENISEINSIDKLEAYIHHANMRNA